MEFYQVSSHAASKSGDKIRAIHNLPSLSAHASLLNLPKSSGDQAENQLSPQSPPGQTELSVRLDSTSFETIDVSSCYSCSGFTQLTTDSNDKSEADSEIALASHSIESFFGRVDDFEELYKVLCIRYTEASPSPDNIVASARASSARKLSVIQPEYVRKILFVGNPLAQLKGINRFIRLTEVWIVDCNIGEILKTDFDELNLRKLYLYNNRIRLVESDAVSLKTLRVLWINGNQVKSLEFLAEGLPALEDLNVASNLIGSLYVKDFLKCSNLRTLNISGNPLHTVEDVVALRSIPSLRTLYLSDPLYGKCPVSSYCDSRTMLLSALGNQISCLDGKDVVAQDIVDVKDYICSRGLYYYANAVRVVANQSTFRKSSLVSSNRKLSELGTRLEVLLDLNSRYRRIISNVQVIPIFTNAKNIMREQVGKIDQRISKILDWAGTSLRREYTQTQLSRWEQEAEKWIKLVEFRSHGNTQCHILLSVHGPRVGNPNEFCSTIHELLAGLCCKGIWPVTILPKVETVIVIRDIGMDQGIQGTYERLYAPNIEPKFVMPEDDFGPATPPRPNGVSGGGPTLVIYPTLPKVVTTYMDPDYKPPPLLYPYPDSIVGLPDRAETVYLFLVCPLPYVTQPLTYLEKVMNDKGVRTNGIRLTNCMWHALRKKNVTFGILLLVKVLKEAITFVKACKREMTGKVDDRPKHGSDCGTFTVTEPQALSPSYVFAISFTPELEKTDWKIGTVESDNDIVGPAKIALATLTDKIVRHGHLNPIRPGQNKKSQFIRKGADGGLACDLSSTVPYMTPDGDLDKNLRLTQIPSNYTGQSGIDSLTKFFGPDVTLRLTSVDLSGNKLRTLIGLEGMDNLKKLNLSHNNLMDIVPLVKVPSLIELKVSWNCLRSLHACVPVLQMACPRVLTIEILPNPFQDVRELSHVSAVLKRSLPALNRCDDWIGGWKKSPEIPLFMPDEKEATFNQIAMKESWGSSYAYRDLAGKSLTDLGSMPESPPVADHVGTDGIDLDLSNNYLSSLALAAAPFVTKVIWRTAVVQLELQENDLRNLDWLVDRGFPNVQILNLANNWLTEVHTIPKSCPALRHLILCSNPIPRDGFVLIALSTLVHLTMVDCTGAPITSHPAYSYNVARHLGSVQILDGIPMVKWNLMSDIESNGGVMTQDWLDERLGSRNFSTLKHLSLPNSNLQKVTLCGSAVPNLTTLDLSGNRLTSFTSLTALPGLKVLQMSHNKVSSLGSSTCPLCFSNTVQSQLAIASKQDPTLPMLPSPRKPRPIFPKLEVLILSHNDLSSLNDLHMHAMPRLQTLLCHCNHITSLNGFEGSGTIRAIVLDKNRIRDVPFDCFTGCNSLRYLHLEHNRLTALPKSPQLASLAALHLGFNKIQSLSDTASMSGLIDLSLAGNPATRRADYRFRIAACLPFLHTLDGHPLSGERLRLQELYAKSLPAESKLSFNQPLLSTFSPWSPGTSRSQVTIPKSSSKKKTTHGSIKRKVGGRKSKLKNSQ